MVKLYPVLLSTLLLGCSSDTFSADSGHPPDGARSDGALDLPGFDRAQPDLSRPDWPQPDLSRPDWPQPDLPPWPDFGPERAYQDIEHLSDDALKAALHDLVRSHHSLGYDDAKAAMFTLAGGGIDVLAGVIECVYTGITAAHDGTKGPGTLNTEHSWPKSDGANTEPATSDINHLFPCDNSANSYRGSLPFGETDCLGSNACTWSVGGSAIGPVVGGTAKVFMVRPSRRGDVARAHFYFSVRYQMPIPQAEEKWLRTWNLVDAPDQLEIARAAAIEGLQNKRNPFVDRPDFVEQIGDF